MMENVPYINTLIIGSGAAAYNCADWLYDLGVKEIAILTENRLSGTSRNTGSDKQTYYKLSLAGEEVDSVGKMAQTLFSGGGADGDLCLVEAANSLRSFFKLCRIGVPFPYNEYGEYVGYKTDHDPLQRATSVGPLTSKMMTECLEREIVRKHIRILDRHYAVKIVAKENKVCGVIVALLDDQGAFSGWKTISCEHVVLATGGPAGVYLDSVYPGCHLGSSSLAIECGAEMSNLCEWQYGLASTRFRWNVSGTYQQVLPRYISVDENGNEREFLPEYFSSPQEALDMVFLKGYQWPFDARKINGSSMIDLIVMYEKHVKGNQIFMDFRQNPIGAEDLRALSAETYGYLKNSGALQGRPVDRLEKMNEGAIALYRAHGIDLYKEPLEVSVCAQHLNGGVCVDTDYESSVENLYVCGEAAGTFGIYRPGGTALNSGQVGSMRIAQHIAGKEKRCGQADPAGILLLEKALSELKKEITRAQSEKSTIAARRLDWQRKMSASASCIRRAEGIRKCREEFALELRNFYEHNRISKKSEICELLRNRDVLISACAVLDSMLYEYGHAGSRGGAIFIEGDFTLEDGRLTIRVKPERKECREEVFLTAKKDGDYVTRSRARRPIPMENGWFETVWRDFRESGKEKIEERNDEDSH